jgi:hypothetical protein
MRPLKNTYPQREARYAVSLGGGFVFPYQEDTMGKIIDVTVRQRLETSISIGESIANSGRNSLGKKMPLAQIENIKRQVIKEKGKLRDLLAGKDIQ